MAISLASLRRNDVTRPPIVLFYGVPGVGKSLFASEAPNPVFIQTEDGLGSIPAQTFGMVRSYGEIMECIGSLLSEPHDFQTVVLDSLDHAEPLVQAETCREHSWKDIEAPGYGKGYAAALTKWRELIEGFTALRDERGMAVIYLAHSTTKRYDNPETEPYDRFQIKLNDKAAGFLVEQADAVLFAKYRINTTENKTDPGKVKGVRGVGGSDRIICTNERPAFLAKNRYGMPDTLPKEWAAVAQFIPFYATANAPAQAA